MVRRLQWRWWPMCEARRCFPASTNSSQVVPYVGTRNVIGIPVVANQAAINRQGLEGEVKQLMQLRLANPEQANALKQGTEPLIAYVPSGDEKSWSAIEAFDSAGNPVYLDVHQPPARPVLVVEADPVKAKNAGLKVMRKALAAADMQVTPRATSNTTSLKTSILKKIRLNDDQEPWLLGAAEVYAEKFAQGDGRLPATFEIIQGHAWKAAPKTTEDGRSIVRFQPRPPAR